MSIWIQEAPRPEGRPPFLFLFKSPHTWEEALKKPTGSMATMLSHLQQGLRDNLVGVLIIDAHAHIAQLLKGVKFHCPLEVCISVFPAHGNRHLSGDVAVRVAPHHRAGFELYERAYKEHVLLSTRTMPPFTALVLKEGKTEWTVLNTSDGWDDHPMDP